MADYDLSSVNELFKTVYGKLSDKLYNSQNVLLARVNKQFDFTGKEKKITLPGSFGGSVGSGTLPTANTKSYLSATITVKELYATMAISRKEMFLSKSDSGAFVNLLTESIRNTVESFSRNLNRILLGDGTGALGTMDGTNTGAGSSGDPFIVLISDATYNSANWSDGDYVNIGSGTDKLEVVLADDDIKTIHLVIVTGTPSIGASDTDILYMQGSKDNDPIGLAGTVGITTGTPYGINIATSPRFRSTREDANGAEISPQLMNKVMLKVHKKTGQYPDLVLTSYEQFIKLENQLEDQKYITLGVKGELKSTIGFDALEIIAGSKRLPVVIDRFCKPGEMWLINEKQFTLMYASKPQWVNEDGATLLRQASSDGFDARYAAYLEAFIIPAFHAQIHDLSITA